MALQVATSEAQLVTIAGTLIESVLGCSRQSGPQALVHRNFHLDLLGLQKMRWAQLPTRRKTS